MTSFWPTSTDAVNTAKAILLVGGVALVLIAISYALEFLQDRLIARSTKANADALDQLQAEMAHEAQAQAVRRAQLELARRTGTRR